MIGELIARLSADRLEWAGWHVGLLYTFVTAGLIFAPNLVGESQGSFDRESGKLPCVQWVGYESACDWRLVEVIENSALLIS
jgi:hypothetical protein